MDRLGYNWWYKFWREATRISEMSNQNQNQSWFVDFFGGSLFFDPVAGIAERNPLAESYKQHLLSFLPAMRQYKLVRAAEHLEQWALGTLDRQPLLDVSACSGLIIPFVRVDSMSIQCSRCFHWPVCGNHFQRWFCLPGGARSWRAVETVAMGRWFPAVSNHSQIDFSCMDGPHSTMILFGNLFGFTSMGGYCWIWCFAGC